ncbi:MAG TPA: nuclear transport factor 2 family protein [Candidatus Sulfotelmatobacter sp.]|nr:nuclear transport factor 2 family protein [Candidatus Sulfotelmatobacter sp.]
MAILPKRLRKQVLRAGVALMLLAGFAFAEDLRAPAKEEALKAFIAHYLSPSGAAQTVQSPYVFAWADLKDDGQSEAITYLTGPGWCGAGGCTAPILAPKDSTYFVIAKVTVTRLPIRVLSSKTNGWHDLAVSVAGGGISSGFDARLSFDGKTYPDNPSALPAIRLDENVGGTVVISEDDDESQVGMDAIKSVVSLQQDAWNRHDLEGFMQGYWNSAELTFFSGGHENHGWQQALDHYRAAYSSPGHEMGKLKFANLRIEMLSANSAFARGEFHLTMPDGKTPQGLFTLIFRKFPEGWKIVHDHSSAE